MYGAKFNDKASVGGYDYCELSTISLDKKSRQLAESSRRSAPQGAENMMSSLRPAAVTVFAQSKTVVSIIR